jgi:2-oxoglutarate dehydrogenase E1 component
MKLDDIKEIQKELLENFGSNYAYAADILERYLENANDAPEQWRAYFDSKLKNGGPSDVAGQETQVQPSVLKSKSAVKQAAEPLPADAQLIAGVGAKIIENMNSSLTVPTASSYRNISVKLLEEHRRIINGYLKRTTGGKVSYTHIIAYAIMKALNSFPNINYSYKEVNGKSYLIKKERVNVGIAVDVQRKDGSRSLVVPNIKDSQKMNFKEFMEAYDALIDKTKEGKIDPADFQETTISLTNPGTVGTAFSNPRLMSGQGAIIAVGAIDYPPEYKAMSAQSLAALGIGKVLTVSCTYDHRIIQGAESGMFLNEINDLLLGEKDFYGNIFLDLKIPQKPLTWRRDTLERSAFGYGAGDDIEKQARVLQLINIYRVRGHLNANLNPLSSEIRYHQELDPANYGFTIWDFDRRFITGGLGGKREAALRDILDILQKTYCEKIGIEYMHIQNPEEKSWLQAKMEPVMNLPKFEFRDKIRILWKLTVAETFERFLHTKFIGHKRFSLEGSETVLPVLDYLVNLAADDGAEELYMGMAHRGRLNILANIIGKKYAQIFAEFEENIDPESIEGSGDVKYHLGASEEYMTPNGKKIRVSLASNPSHLEWVNPIVEGVVRAKQIRAHDAEKKKFIPVLLHGDAAFAGQGVVPETLSLSQLKGYRTGGTIHIIINNQIGFTTMPDDARSSPYAADVAKMVQAPILHVNGEDPEAALWVTKLAFEYRQTFKKDIVIDLIGFRLHGHNEGDDPSITQPLMYKKIKTHPSVRETYAKRLVKEKVINPDEDKKIVEDTMKCLNDSYDHAKSEKFDFKADVPLAAAGGLPVTKENFRSDVDFLKDIVRSISDIPEGFHLHPKLTKFFEKRRALLETDASQQEIDWATGEAIALGALAAQGVPIRLSGQDSARGTFNQRHLILYDHETEAEYIPLNHINPMQARVEPLDSMLSEAAVLGFELGYSIADPRSLVLWEAQFGDFANGAQVIIDNFLVSSYVKWGVPNKLTLLLPHGYEGQGPEHSSARIERFLILCAEDNMQVCYPTTPAQYNRLLIRQGLSEKHKPLIVFTPKSLLRLPEAKSSLQELTEGNYNEVIDDASIQDKTKAARLIFCSGKVYYDLLHYKKENNIEDAALIRLEQYYPFPEEELINIISSYKNASVFVWAQEEPQNMGAWNFLRYRMEELLNGNKIKYAGRTASASPAVGSLKTHQLTQAKLVKEAFTI